MRLLKLESACLNDIYRLRKRSDMIANLLRLTKNNVSLREKVADIELERLRVAHSLAETKARNTRTEVSLRGELTNFVGISKRERHLHQKNIIKLAIGDERRHCRERFDLISGLNRDCKSRAIAYVSSMYFHDKYVTDLVHLSRRSKDLSQARREELEKRTKHANKRTALIENIGCLSRDGKNIDRDFARYLCELHDALDTPRQGRAEFWMFLDDFRFHAKTSSRAGRWGQALDRHLLEEIRLWTSYMQALLFDLSESSKKSQTTWKFEAKRRGIVLLALRNGDETDAQRRTPAGEEEQAEEGESEVTVEESDIFTALLELRSVLESVAESERLIRASNRNDAKLEDSKLVHLNGVCSRLVMISENHPRIVQKCGLHVLYLARDLRTWLAEFQRRYYPVSSVVDFTKVERALLGISDVSVGILPLLTDAGRARSNEHGH
eukprot:g4367.t1